MEGALLEGTMREKKDEAKSATEGKQQQSRLLYPKHTLEETLRIPTAIHEKYNAKPMPPKSLAEAIGLSWRSGTFETLLAASNRYGLTTGSFRTKQVALTELGASILSPRSSDEKAQALAKGARNPEAFRRVYEHYEGSEFPEEQFFLSILVRDFGIPREECARFTEIIKANARYGLASGRTQEIAAAAADGHEEEPSVAATEARVPAQVPETAVAVPRHVRVFISHSENEAILEIVRTTMEIAGFQYEIAEKQETTAKPVPQKVLDAMRRCTAAVVVVSADEKEKRSDGTYGVNQNVLIEIGAAFVLYDPNVVLVWDKRVPVPSNLQGLYRCEYEGAELSGHDVLKLQRSIANFRPT